MIESNLTPEERFLAWASSGNRNVFLTGQAGTGKSTLLSAWLQACQLQHHEVAITASTGIAAINIGGTTIHRFSGIQLGPGPTETFEDAADRLQSRSFPAALRAFDRVRKAKTVVIDEISMLPGRQLDFLDYWFGRLRENREPFGGVQMIFVGDFLQLPPVRTSDDRPYDWAFSSAAWANIDKTIELTEVRRQDENDFTYALGRVRIGELRGMAGMILKPHVLENPEVDRPRLYTHNAQVDKWCNYILSELTGEPVVIHAIRSGPPSAVDELARNILAPDPLVLKPGALVMNLVNRTIDGVYLANGQLGHVIRIERDLVTIRLAGGEEVGITRHKWGWSHRVWDPDAPSYEQFPLRLAWALTIHKAQGMTLEEAHIDIRAAREPGQAYVALSRVRTLAGLSLKEWPKGLFVSPQAIAFYGEQTPGSPLKCPTKSPEPPDGTEQQATTQMRPEGALDAQTSLL